VKFKIITLIFISLLVSSVNAQVLVKGEITDENNELVFSANVIVKGTYRGVYTDLHGLFEIEIQPTDTLLFTYIGYVEQEFTLNDTNTDTIKLNIKLRPEVNLLTGAIISARKKLEATRISSASLTQQQIFTTAGDPGNLLYSAQEGSSASVNPESGRLLTRGGRASETRFFMDGLLLGSPYSNTPNGVTTRLQQNPYMIERVNLYNGGFSTEYGQALSSVMVMNTKKKLNEDKHTVSLSTVGLNANLQKKVGKGGIIFNTDFIDLTVNNKLTVTNLDWVKPYRSLATQLLWKAPIDDDKQLKVYVNRHTNSMKIQNEFDGELSTINLNGNNLGFSVFYKHLLSDKWDYSIASTYQQVRNETQIESNLSEDLNDKHFHFKGIVKRYFDHNLTVKSGIEFFRNQYQQDVLFEEDLFEVNNKTDHNNLAFFLEGEKKLKPNWTLRSGIRIDDLNNFRRVLSFRTLLGYELNKQISLAAFYGTFYQLPDADFMYYADHLKNEKSEQLMLTANYHTKKRDINLSVYRKNYHQLIKYDGDFRLDPNLINNNGDGYVEGVDVQYTDNDLIPSCELKASYSYTYSIRDYRNYISYKEPAFIYRHRMNLSAKKFVPSISSHISLTAVVAGGKYFDNPNTIDQVERDDLGVYKSLSFNYTYLTRILGSSISYIHLSVDNILNLKNEVGINYIDKNHFVPIQSNNRRSIFLALIINF